MDDSTHTHTHDPSTAPAGTTTQAPAVVTPPVVTVQPEDHERSGFSFGSFAIGFLAALLAGAIGIAVFFAVSDADDDGRLELDVPAVEVDVGG